MTQSPQAIHPQLLLKSPLSLFLDSASSEPPSCIRTSNWSTSWVSELLQSVHCFFKWSAPVTSSLTHHLSRISCPQPIPPSHPPQSSCVCFCLGLECSCLLSSWTTSSLPRDLFKGYFFIKSLLDLIEESHPHYKYHEFLARSELFST